MSDETCRICFSTTNLLSIHTPTDEGLISEKITKLANVEISSEDGLPQYVCDDCSLNLDYFLKFKQQIEESDDYLRSSLNLADVPEECIMDWKIEADESGNVNCDVSFAQKTVQSQRYTAVSNPTPKKYKEKKMKEILSSIICDKVLGSRVGPKYHMKCHNRINRYQCDLCPKAFRSFFNLQEHRRLHTGEKPYTCEFCCRSFAQCAGLLAHHRLHIGENPFQCDVCFKKFKISSRLKYHIAQQHTGEKHHACEVCRKSFDAKGNLTQHTKIHTGEKTFTCSICSRSFLRRFHLKRHMLTHSKDKKFKCEICCRAFTQKYDLKRHMNVHN